MSGSLGGGRDDEQARPVNAGFLQHARGGGIAVHRRNIAPAQFHNASPVLLHDHKRQSFGLEHRANHPTYLLMFGVGLHFSIKDLLAVRRIAIPISAS